MNHYIFDEESCALANGKFFYPSSSKDQCWEFMYCWGPDSIVTGLLNPPNESTGQCKDGETQLSLFEWKDAEWIGGKLAGTNWTKRESVKANMIANMTNFPLLQLSVSFPAVLSQRTFLQNQVSLILFGVDLNLFW